MFELPQVLELLTTEAIFGNPTIEHILNMLNMLNWLQVEMFNNLMCSPPRKYPKGAHLQHD